MAEPPCDNNGVRRWPWGPVISWQFQQLRAGVHSPSVPECMPASTSFLTAIGLPLALFESVAANMAEASVRS